MVSRSTIRKLEELERLSLADSTNPKGLADLIRTVRSLADRIVRAALQRPRGRRFQRLTDAIEFLGRTTVADEVRRYRRWSN